LRLQGVANFRTHAYPAVYIYVNFTDININAHVYTYQRINSYIYPSTTTDINTLTDLPAR
jgi:hypothetical protein